MSTPGIEQLVGKLADSRELEAAFRLLDVAQELCELGLNEPDDSWCRESGLILLRVEEREPL